MHTLRPVLLVVGIFLTVLAGAMVIPFALDLAIGGGAAFSFAVAGAVTLFIGGGLWLTQSGFSGNMSVKSVI